MNIERLLSPYMKKILLYLLMGVFFGCYDGSKNTNPKLDQLPVVYAEGFSIWKTEEGMVLEVKRPYPGASESIT